MDYSVYNDYEILYLIHEGNACALKLMMDKYTHLIYETARMYYPEGSHMADLMQEGFMVLYDCIRKYHMPSKASFYSYFLLSYRRRIFRLLKNDYYTEIPHFNEDMPDESSGYYTHQGLFYEGLTEEDKRMTEEIIFNGLSYREYGLKHGLSISQVCYRYQKLIEKLKKRM